MKIADCDRKKTGIYAIRCVANNRIYVGATYQSLSARLNIHLGALRTGSHYNRAFQQDWDQLGEQAFVFELLEERLPEDQDAAYEQQWIDGLQAMGFICYNIAPAITHVRHANSPSIALEPAWSYTLVEIARYFRIHVKTVRNLIKDGHLRAGRVGRAIRVTREDLMAYKKKAWGQGQKHEPDA